MATVTKPIALDESINTTEQTPRNIADVLAEELKGIADSISTAESVEDILSDMATTKTAPTISGTAVFDTVDGNLVKALKVAITPSQDLHGYPNPWVGGAGKNKLDDSKYEGFPISRSGITLIKNDDGSITIDGTSTNSFVVDIVPATAHHTLPKGKYILSDNWNKDGNFGLFLSLWNSTTRVVQDLATTYGEGIVESEFDTEPYTYDRINLGIFIPTGKTYNNYTIYPMIRLATESDSTYEPYENICLISGHTEEVISVKDSTDTTQKTYTTPFNQTVYGGTLDVLKGELTITHGIVDLGDLNWQYQSSSTRFMTTDLSNSIKNVYNPSIIKCEGLNPNVSPVSARDIDATICPYSNGYIYACLFQYTDATAFKTAMSGIHLVYELATPTTLSLTPQTVKALVGENHIQASTGEVTECKFSMLINGDDLEMLLS